MSCRVSGGQMENGARCDRPGQLLSLPDATALVTSDSSRVDWTYQVQSRDSPFEHKKTRLST
jgi:hypothetical protein